MPSIDTLINEPSANPFRRLSVKRRQSSDGLFETDWQSLTSYVQTWGSLDSAIDDVRLNRFKHSGVNLKVKNDDGKFNPESSSYSFWSGYLTRYRTLVKIEAGYKDDAGTEYPTDPTVGVFIMDDEISINDHSNDVILNCSSLRSIFDEVRARDVTGLGAVATASDIIAKIRDHTDGSSRFVFRQFITSTAWSIQATTVNYNPATTTSLEEMTCWELMEKLAEAEGYVIYITRTGGVTFKDRTPNTTASQFSFYGVGFPRMNLMRIDDFKEALNKVYNFVRFKYLEPDTSSSFVTSGTITSVDPSNTPWKYGARVYEFENLLTPSATTAQTISDTVFNYAKEVKNEMQLKAKFVPHIDILDRVDVSYQLDSIDNAIVWDGFDWDAVDWPAEGVSFDFTNRNFKIFQRRINLDDFSTQFRMREI